MSKLLSIAAELSAPPSSPSAFRDVTLFSTSKGYEVIAFAPPIALPGYHRWFKLYGLYDYLYDLIPEEDVPLDDCAVVILGGSETRLTAHNLNVVLGLL